MSFIDEFVEHVNAGFSGIYVQTEEAEEFVAELAEAAPKSWLIATWDISKGVRAVGREAGASAADSRFRNTIGNPVPIIEMAPQLRQLCNATGTTTTIVVLHAYHAFLGATPQIVRLIHNAIRDGKANAVFFVVTAPYTKIPIELERHFVVLDHPLPDRAQLEKIARDTAERPGELPEGHDLDRLMDAAAGLTRNEAENAFALSLARHAKVTPDTVWELKIAGLKKSGLLSVHKGGETFADLGGLDGLKRFAKRIVESVETHPLAKPKGLLLVGAPGTGKSAWCKALGNEVGRPTIALDIGSIKDKHVGESERKMRQALKQIDQMAPAICYVDEVEKALAGVGSANDSGVTDSLFGTLLTWLNDHTSDVFVIMTANDLGTLLEKAPEFARPGRFNGIFFVDVPTPDEREVIWKLYLNVFGIDAKVTRPDDNLWTGAEIRECCSLARRLYGKGDGNPITDKGALKDAAIQIVPVAISASDQLSRRRQWAHDRYLDAQTGTRYNIDKAAAIIDGRPINGTESRRVIQRARSPKVQ